MVSPPCSRRLERRYSCSESNHSKRTLQKLYGTFLLLFARNQGIGADRLLEILTDTLFTAPFYKAYGSLMVNETVKPAGFKLRLGLKELELLLEETHGSYTAMLSASSVRDQLMIAVQQGLGDHDVASFALIRRFGFGAM